MNTFFVADTHFGHARIVELGHRPFATVQEMDDTLVANWNAVVQPRDLVYHVGDFSFAKPIPYLDRLNGRIYLVTGNHDRKRLNLEAKARFAAVVPYAEVTVGGHEVTLCHYALRVWNKSHHGAWHLYGHSHGTLGDDPYSLSLDVGVDCWWWRRGLSPADGRLEAYAGRAAPGTRRPDFRPLSLAEVEALMAKKSYKPVDHHEPDDDE